MPIALLLCVICSIAASNGNVQEDIDISKDRMVQTKDNPEFVVDVDANDFPRLPTIQGNEKNVELRQAIADRPFAENRYIPPFYQLNSWKRKMRRQQRRRKWRREQRRKRGKGERSIEENVEVLQGIADRPRRGKRSIAENVEALQGIADRPRKG